MLECGKRFSKRVESPTTNTSEIRYISGQGKKLRRERGWEDSRRKEASCVVATERLGRKKGKGRSRRTPVTGSSEGTRRPTGKKNKRGVPRNFVDQKYINSQ